MWTEMVMWIQMVIWIRRYVDGDNSVDGDGDVDTGGDLDQTVMRMDMVHVRWWMEMVNKMEPDVWMVMKMWIAMLM